MSTRSDRPSRPRRATGSFVLVEQQIRFCTAPDGVRLAYAVRGRGPPIVRVATWMTHLDVDGESPVWRHWVDELADGHALVRYDERGCGLSDREFVDLSVDTWVADLEAVIEAAGLDRFALLGVSQGAAIAVVYAARHPDRLTHLALYGGYARGRKVRGGGARRDEDALDLGDPRWVGRPGPDVPPPVQHALPSAGHR